MQVVVRVEKAHPPAHTPVLCATGSAVALALAAFTAPDADPETRARTERWRSGPIRKVVRRARGAGWERQLAVPGVRTHHAHGVDVAVHVPGPVDQVDPEISRLQVGGLTLEDPDTEDPDTEDPDTEDPDTEDPDTEDPGARAAADPRAARLWLNPRVRLTTGKAAAQVAHAAQLVLQSLRPDDAADWVAAGAPLDVSVARQSEWDRLVATLPVVVTDGGFTEVPPGTITVVAAVP